MNDHDERYPAAQIPQKQSARARSGVVAPRDIGVILRVNVNQAWVPLWMTASGKSQNELNAYIHAALRADTGVDRLAPPSRFVRVNFTWVLETFALSIGRARFYAKGDFKKGDSAYAFFLLLTGIPLARVQSWVHIGLDKAMYQVLAGTPVEMVKVAIEHDLDPSIKHTVFHS